MASSKEWFIASRAENLAIVLLTRFPVTVAREPDIDRGIDLRVIIDPEKPGLREFSVQGPPASSSSLTSIIACGPKSSEPPGGPFKTVHSQWP
jgi:hypothetical protein